MFEMGSLDLFEYLKHKLWQKKVGSQTANLTPDN